MIRAACAAAALAAGCQSGVDLSPTLETGATAVVEAQVVRTLRMQFGGQPGVLDVGFTRTLTVDEGGELGVSAVAITERSTSLRLRSDGATLDQATVWSSADGGDLPDAFTGLDALLGVDRTVRIEPDGTVHAPPVIEAMDLEGGLETWFVPLAHTPAGKVRAGATWHHELPARDDVPWFRTWTLLSIGEDRALLEAIDVAGSPSADPGPTDTQARIRLEVDTRTGRPLSYRQRDLTRPVKALDVTATLTWDGPDG